MLLSTPGDTLYEVDRVVTLAIAETSIRWLSS